MKTNDKLSVIIYNLKNNQIKISFISLILYKFALDFIYIFLLYPIYSYTGFLLEFSILRWGISMLTLSVFAFPLTKIISNNRCSSKIVTIISCVYFIPMLTMYAFNNYNIAFLIYTMIYWGIMIACQLLIPYVHLKYSNKTNKSNKSLMIIAIVCIAVVMYFSGKYTGFRITLNFINVYGIRGEAAGYHLSVIGNYVLSMMSIVVPMIIAYLILIKKYLFSVIMIITNIFLFSITAQKSIFFIMLVAILCIFLYRDWMIKYLPGILTLGIGLSFIENIIFKTPYILSLFYRRLMFLTNKISYEYFCFFKDNNIDIFRQGILGKLGADSTYDIPIARVIGEQYYNQINNANNGMLGDVFANLGVVGIFILPIVLIIIFRVLDCVSEGLDNRIVIVPCIYYAMAFINGSWSTVLLSNGFLVVCVLLFFYPRKGEKYNEK